MAGGSPTQHQSVDVLRRRVFPLFVLPALAMYCIFMVGPLLYTGWISLHKWNGNGPMEWRGLRNYQVLVKDPMFRDAFVNTLLVLFVVGGLVFAISFMWAMLIREMQARNFARRVVFFPFVVSSIVLSIVWGFIFQYDGLVNHFIGSLGMEPVRWLAEDNLLKVIGGGLVWINVGLYVTILLAGVDRIPEYFYEEAELSGATAFQRFRYVTLPLSWDVVSVAIILWTINSLKIFEFILVFGGGSGTLPSPRVWNGALFIYGVSFGGVIPSYLFGYASAAAVVMLVLFGLLVAALRRLLSREAVEY
ncbi:MAG: sugar transporter permease [Marmoricola sp.]|nr:sugar transporter permease [Marmoricola sp.]